MTPIQSSELRIYVYISVRTLNRAPFGHLSMLKKMTKVTFDQLSYLFRQFKNSLHIQCCLVGTCLSGLREKANDLEAVNSSGEFSRH